MNIPKNQIKIRTRLGSLGDRSVYGIGSIGGLYLVVAEKGTNDFETLGAGSHIGIAKHAALRIEPKIVFDALSKSESDDSLLQEYIELTHQIRSHE